MISVRTFVERLPKLNENKIKEGMNEIASGSAELIKDVLELLRAGDTSPVVILIVHGVGRFNASCLRGALAAIEELIGRVKKERRRVIDMEQAYVNEHNVCVQSEKLQAELTNELEQLKKIRNELCDKKASIQKAYDVVFDDLNVIAEFTQAVVKRTDESVLRDASKSLKRRLYEDEMGFGPAAVQDAVLKKVSKYVQQ